MTGLLSAPVSVDSIRKLLERAKAELAVPGRSNWLIFAAGGIAAVLVLAALSAAVDAERLRQIAARAEIARLSALVADKTWDQRLAESRDLRARMENRLWPAPTPGLAEASFEAWLRERFQAHGLEVQQVMIARAQIEETSSDSSSPQNVETEKITAKVISNFRPEGAVNVAADIAEKDKLVVVERLIIRAGRNARMEMDVATYLSRP